MILIPLFSGIFVRFAFPDYSYAIISFPLIGIFFYSIIYSKSGFLSGMFFAWGLGLSLSTFILHTLFTFYDIGFFLSVLFYFSVTGIFPAMIWGGMGSFFKILLKKLDSEKSIFKNISYIFAVGTLFVLIEWIRTNYSPEYGWGHFATIFYKVPEILSFAVYIGGSGLSFSVIVTAGLLLIGVLTFKKSRIKSVIYFLIPIIFYLAVYIHGYFRINTDPGLPYGYTRFSLIHPAIGQKERWREKYNKKTLNLYKNLSLSNSSHGKADINVIVWPETALTYMIQSNKETLKEIKEITNKTDSYLITGAPSYKGNAKKRRFYNTAFLFSKAGEIISQYDKINLVPFAEKEIVLFNNDADRDHKLYTSGKNIQLFNVKNEKFDFNLAPLICYEAMISSLVTEYKNNGADILLNITNDAWFGNSSESAQQLSILALLCAENNIYGIRSTGYGISAFIDNFGRIKSASKIEEKLVFSKRLPLYKTGSSFYSRHPDWFVLASLIYLIFFYYDRIYSIL